MCVSALRILNVQRVWRRVQLKWQNVQSQTHACVCVCELKFYKFYLYAFESSFYSAALGFPAEPANVFKLEQRKTGNGN